MVGRKRGDIPKSLARGRDSFEAWRRSRKVGARIPDKLGTAAGLPGLVEIMRTRGYGEPLIEKLCWRNWLRVLERTWA